MFTQIFTDESVSLVCQPKLFSPSKLSFETLPYVCGLSVEVNRSVKRPDECLDHVESFDDLPMVKECAFRDRMDAQVGQDWYIFFKMLVLLVCVIGEGPVKTCQSIGLSALYVSIVAVVQQKQTEIFNELRYCRVILPLLAARFL